MAEKFSTSDVVSFLTGERACPFISSSSDSEVDGGTNEELEIGAGPVKRVRILSSMVERVMRVTLRIYVVSQAVRRVQVVNVLSIQRRILWIVLIIAVVEKVEEGGGELEPGN